MEIVANNKRVYHDFFVSDCVEAGISLQGCEVKSIRAGGVSLAESFVTIKDGQVWLMNAYIKPYQAASSQTDTNRPRKLLLRKDQIAKLSRKVSEKGYTLVATKLYFNPKGLVKVEIALAKGKKLYDKRQTLKDRAVKRDIQRALKEN